MAYLKALRRKFISDEFYDAPRGAPGRRLVRRLNNDAMRRARNKSGDPKHEAKFLNSSARYRVAMRTVFSPPKSSASL